MGTEVAKKKRALQSELKKLLEKMEKPKKPLTAYGMFAREFLKTLPKGLSPKEKMTQYEKKSSFKKKVEEESKTYDKALEMWNMKMEKEGKMSEIIVMEGKLAELKVVELNLI